MSQGNTEQWPHYTYIVPQVYTKAKVRLIGLGNYAPSGTITNEFFAYISTRLGDPRSADDLERVTGLSTRHVRASTMELCRRMAGADAQTEYQWAPPGRPGPNLRYRFCKTCGVRTVGQGEYGSGRGPFYFIAIASLDDADPDELSDSIRYVDGRHDRFDRPPDDIRLM